MKHIYLVTCILLTVALITAGCAKKGDDQMVSDDNESIQNNDEQTALNENNSLPDNEEQTALNENDSVQNNEPPDFSNRKPFKYTITTDIKDDSSENINILIQMNTMGNQAEAIYDLDCEGDGEYEFTGLSLNQTCIYKRHTGKHQIWIRGDIPGVWLCTGHFNTYDTSVKDEIKQCQKLSYDELKHNLYCLNYINDNNNSFEAVVSVDDWGDVSYQSMFGFAAYCKNLNHIPEESPNFERVTEMSSMFYDSTFNQPLDHWDVSNVTNMAGMFMNAKSFNQPLEKWDVSSVTNMSYMFDNASKFNQPLGKWDVSSVANMSGMFLHADKFNQSLDKWNVSNVKDMSRMFTGAKKFNQPLEKWNVSNVTNMSYMFNEAYSLQSTSGKVECFKCDRYERNVSECRKIQSIPC